jgi:broad specificity phosphatase PhoE
MTAWILVRHGATDWNRDGRYQGQADPPLNEEGWAQAARLAEVLAPRPVEALYSSDLKRARDTAERVAQRLGVPVFVEPRLREINQGAWEGMLVGDIASGYPEDWRAIQDDPLHARAPGGESVAEVAQRALACLGDIAQRFPRGPVVIISHGLTLGCVLCLARGLSLEDARRNVPMNGEPVELAWP